MSWGILAAIAGSFLIACLTLSALWLQSIGNRIRPLDAERLYVEYSAIRRDKEGYFIPCYGRLISNKLPELEKHPEVVRCKGKVALICDLRTPENDGRLFYVVSRVVPI
jgi:hypothetical protein